MPEGYPREIEVERVINVVRGFGWEKVSEELKGDELFLTVKKPYKSPEATTTEDIPT
jgi:hypothetical protein